LDLVESARLREGERVLDVACGTGIVARLAAERVGTSGSVTGVDLTAGMLNVARAVSSDVPVHIQWYETSAEAMPLPDAAYDVAFCQLALMFIPDKAAALREIRRVLAASGRALVSVPGPTAFFQVLHDAFERRSMKEAAGFVRAVFSLHDASEFEQLFHDAGFTVVDVRAVEKQVHLPSGREFFWHYMRCTPLADWLDRLDEKMRTSIEEDVVSGWQKWAGEGGMTYAQPMLIAAARP
jgi:ubiquinone/menaquinone biosynthesis C-methylase UbiE